MVVIAIQKLVCVIARRAGPGRSVVIVVRSVCGVKAVPNLVIVTMVPLVIISLASANVSQVFLE